MPKNATPINLTDEETCYLESLVNKGTIEARVYRRAKILLLKSAGISNEAMLEPGGINHSESSRNNQSELIRNSQCTCLADRLPTVIQRDR